MTEDDKTFAARTLAMMSEAIVLTARVIDQMPEDDPHRDMMIDVFATLSSVYQQTKNEAEA